MATPHPDEVARILHTSVLPPLPGNSQAGPLVNGSDLSLALTRWRERRVVTWAFLRDLIGGNKLEAVGLLVKRLQHKLKIFFRFSQKNDG